MVEQVGGDPKAAAEGQVATDDELLEAPERGSVEALLDAGAHDDLDAMRHSTAHVMAEAVLDLFPGTKLGIGPAVADGFYYDFDVPRPLSPEDLAAIEERMRSSVGADHQFVRRELDFADARAAEEGQGQTFKVEILDDLAARATAAGEAMPPVSFYEHGPFSDLCRGPHVESTGKIGPFKLLSVAAAYWRGDEKRPMLQRIYGTVWRTDDELKEFLWRREEARKRDHRRLGVQLDLFSFHNVSPGAAFWHPKGQLLWRLLEGTMRELQARRGYQEVSTPIVVSERVWRQSGHWDLYKENMFLVESENQTFSLKPMNCPESTFIYRSKRRSYRDLPLRFSEFGRLHRNERSGSLSGLTRVRQFIQDDAHLYVRPDQLTAEIQALLGEVREAYGWFGLTPRFTFATKPDKAIGDPALWERAEQLTREAFAAADISYVVKPKDGTFYAPKIDIYIDDALGREWQMATIQIDLTMLPEQFDLTYDDENGKLVRPIAIHRAIYGSIERFIGILIEHFGGAFPLWIAPIQAVIIPIADRHVEPAGELASVLRSRGLRVEVDTSTGRMQNKIRLAQEQKVPYMLVLGDREVEARTVAPRARNAARGEQQDPVGWD
ncbi:MAG TPA: threonine--tRNA ligase, partial [Candidatus Limnocylindrales bacterium]|nr:threonine--tRNA ligase [Candidatus Limnocylindrales bacterium]